MILYGRRPVREALAAGRRSIGPIWATARTAREPWLAGLQVVVERGEALDKRAGSPDHQGVCAEAGGYPYVSAAELLAGDAPLIVALDEVTDPQNVGAIARTAECVGATGLVLCERRAAEVTAAAVKASAGAIEHLRIARVRNLSDFLGEAKQAECWCYGASAEDAAADYLQPDYQDGVVLVIGAEGRGLRPRVAASCDGLVRLPQRGRVASLNASAAAAALLYGILQRRESA